jgi:hypothetical protein
LKVYRGLWTKEKIGDYGEKQAVDSDLEQGMKGAEDGVVSDPECEQPAGPIGTTEHKNPAYDGKYPDKTNPDQFVSDGGMRCELSHVPGQQVVDKSQAAHGDEKPADNRN